MFSQFDQVEYCNVDWQFWPLLFYPVLEFVVSDMNTGPRVPATVGFRTVRFFGALLVNYGKITVLQNTVAQSIKYHIYIYIDNKFSLQFYFLSHLVMFIWLKRRKIQNTVFYKYVKWKYSYAGDDCICRRCDMRLHNFNSSLMVCQFFTHLFCL
jgi:hypothetical protein